MSHREEAVSSGGTLGKRPDLIVTAVLLAVWLAVVIFTATRHEYWRDEVRVLSLVRTAHSPLDLFHVIRYEAHPILWYLIIYLGDSLLHSPLILPIASITVAFAAVTLFMFRAPFPLWLKALFLFSGFPIHEYSVKVRNYGISMLFFFVAASLYPHRRRHWLLLAVSLALLANTNAHSMSLAFLLLVVWMWDERRDRRVVLAAGIVGLGILLSFLVVRVPPDTILSRFYVTSPKEIASAFAGALLYPRPGFRTLFPGFVPWIIVHPILYLAIVGLIRRPILALAAVAGLVALGMLFRLGVPGDYRHVGVFLCFLLTLYWIAAHEPLNGGSPSRGSRVMHVVGYSALTAIILASDYRSRIVGIDIKHPMSSSKALGAFLNAEPSFHDAILVPEPDYYIESLPYYAQNPIYLAREHRFGKTATWSTASAAHLSLGELVAQAQALKAQYRRPVLLVLGHPGLLTEPSGKARMFYGKTFTWTPRELDDLKRSSMQVAEFWAAYSDENYSVYEVK